MASPKNISRRKLLNIIGGASLFGTEPVKLLAQSVLNSLVSSAYAQDEQTSFDNNLVNIIASGAPPGWLLHPVNNAYGNPNENFIANPGVYTRFTSINADNSRGRYITQNIRGINMPTLWSENIPTPSGTVPLSTMMDNLLLIRGVSHNMSGHRGANQLMVQPIPGAVSLTGLVADHSNAPFPAIARADRGSDNAVLSGFKSLRGASQTRLPNNNPLNFMLEPFRNSSGSYRNVAGLQNLIDNLLNQMDSARAPASKRRAFSQNLKNAERIFTDANLRNFESEYNELVRKYDRLFKRSIQTTDIEGVNDRRLRVNGSSDRVRVQINGGGGPRANMSDLRDSITSDTTLVSAAAGFAVTEFALKYRLTSVSTICLRYLGPININGETERRAETDAHQMGDITQNLYFTLYWRATLAGVHEMINQLKSFAMPGNRNMFDHTCIHLCGEFGRKQDVDLRGSDHAERASYALLYKGDIQGPNVIGNCYDTYRTNQNDDYYGSWGEGAPVPELGNEPIKQGNVASTICHLLGVPSPTPNNPSLVRIQNGQASPNISLARNLRKR